MRDLYPPIEPFDSGMLDVGNGNLIYWETCGNPVGQPALVVHGGPGSGCSTVTRRNFDPDRYRVVLFDQRGCGRSTPHASDLSTSLEHNTTEHLLLDMEQLREHLGVQQWLLFGGSWGSTLLLAYAERQPHRVSHIVVAGVTTTSRSEIDWLFRGAGRFFPQQWERFRAGALPDPLYDGDLLASYARMTNDADPAVRAQATDDWCAWEDAVISLEPHGDPTAYSGRPSSGRLALVRICAHYFSHGAWLDEGVLIRDAYRLEGIPSVLLHGKLDLSSPVDTAWHLAQVWSGARLVVVDDSGHTGSQSMGEQIRTALDEFAGR